MDLSISYCLIIMLINLTQIIQMSYFKFTVRIIIITPKIQVSNKEQPSFNFLLNTVLTSITIIIIKEGFRINYFNIKV